MRTMTRAEYEAEFGIAPVVASSSRIDITPAPRVMTRAEYEAEFRPKVEDKPFLSSRGSSYKASVGGAETIAPNLLKTAGNIPSSARDLTRDTLSPVNPFDIESPLNIGSNIVKGAGALKDIFKNNGLTGGVKAIGEGFADTAKKGLDMYKGVGEKIYSNLEKNVLAQDDVAQGVDTSIVELADKVAKIGIEDPLLIPSIIYAPSKVRGTGMTSDVISDIARPVTRGADTSLSNITNKAKNVYNERVTRNIEEELFNIENNYAKTRKANDYQTDAGASSRKRIAETDVLVGAVNSDGLIMTKQPGGAVDKYRKLTIEGSEDVVKQNLKREGAKVNLAEVEQEMAIEMDKIFDGEDLVTALNGVKKEIQGLKARSDDFGDVFLDKIHEAKINTTRHIDFNTPAETKTYRKAKARVYKNIVENKSKVEIEVDGKKYKVKDINAELGKYYQDLERLEALDGKRVKGGKLGKYTAQIAGNIAGGAAGGAIGGLPGAAIGSIVGGEVTGALKGKNMAGTFGKERGVTPVKNPILEKATLEGKLPQKVDLKTPSPKVGARKDIPKTPEISKLEGQIAKNVEAQKKAIKAGDFTLVAKLKEVYEHLVSKLKELIKSYKDMPNKQGGFAKVSFAKKDTKVSVSPESVGKNLSFEDKEIINRILNRPTLGTEIATADFIKTLGIDKLSSKDQISFLKEALDYSNNLSQTSKSGKLPQKQLSQQNQSSANTSTYTKNSQGKFTGSQSPYKGEKDLTTKILRELEGKTTVSKQYILDATNRPELKQVERDLIRDLVEREGDVVNVSDFAKKVKAELLPLKVSGDIKKGETLARYENIALPDELRGNVKDYTEKIYESPIKTSAGDIHFGSSPMGDEGGIENYFGHTRIEDMADNQTRRVIEVQSDLYQKGNLEKEFPKSFSTEEIEATLSKSKLAKFKKAEADYGWDWDESPKNLKAQQSYKELSEKAQKILADKISQQKSKLQQYNDPTAHFRMVREEIKKAAQDGKTKLQFPTGETAMKIEGLGNNNQFWNTSNRGADMVKPEQLEVGKQLYTTGDSWIITDVLGDGKFKAVPKDKVQKFVGGFNGNADASVKIGGKDYTYPSSVSETFDISGKVDTNNPIYKFYEKDVQKYLNKFGGKKVVDDKGVSWIEIPINKEWSKMPIEAFALIGGVGLTANLNK